MYADRYTRPGGFRPGSLGLAIGVNGLILFGLSLTAPHFAPTDDPVLNVVNIPIDRPPPPIDEIKPQPQPQPHDKIVKPVLSPPLDRVDVTRTPAQPVDVGPIPGPVDVTPSHDPLSGSGDGGGVAVAPVHPPLLVGPELDQRYIGLFQPTYPASERLAEREGRVVVRVLIGIDGRVKAVEQVGAATSSAFFEATRKRAFDKWRFKPGTRDGVPVEAWRTMSVRFVLDEE